MPHIIEPANPDAAAEQIVALQDVPAAQEDVLAHGVGPVGGGPLSLVSTVECP